MGKHAAPNEHAPMRAPRRASHSTPLSRRKVAQEELRRAEHTHKVDPKLCSADESRPRVQRLGDGKVPSDRERSSLPSESMRPRRRDLIAREQEEQRSATPQRRPSHKATTANPSPRRSHIETGRLSRRKQALAQATESTTVLEYSELAGAVAEGLKASRSGNRRTTYSRSASKPLVHRATAASWKRRYRAALVAAAGATALAIPLSGFGANLLHAQAAQPLTASIVGGTGASTEAASVPEALTGSSTAAIKSTTHQAQEEASVNPVSSTCSIDSAQGVRAAFVKQDSDIVVYPIATGSYRLSSHFGYRSDPIYGGTSYHAGEDFAAALNTPIYAIADGVVTYAGEGIEGRSNNLIIVEHTIEGHTYQSWYIHMYDDGVLVKAGDKVKAGQQIGKVGSNGNSTGPHLHLEIHDPSKKDASNETAELLDPLAFLTEHSAQDISSLCQ